MADLSSILDQANAIALQQAKAAPPPPPEQSDLRAGLMDFRSGINNAMALGAENLGMKDTSQRLRDENAVLSQQAEQYATPRVKTTSEDVNGPIDAWNKGETGAYVGDTLRNLPSTIVRGLPGMAAPVIAGLAGTAASGGNPLVGLAAGTAATMPQTIGDVAGRQYANKDNTDSAGVRLAKAAGLGTLNAVAQNIVPQWMGGKLVGGVAEHAAAKTLATAASTSARPTIAGAIARNLSEAVGGNAVAGAAGEAMTQYGAGEKFDPNKIGAAGVESGVLGTAFAPLGFAGEMAHRGPNPAEAAAIAKSRAARGLAPDGTPAAPAFGTAPIDPNSATGGGRSFDMPSSAEIPPEMRSETPTTTPAPDTPAGRKAARDAAAATTPPAEAPAPSGEPVQTSMDKAKAGPTIADRLAAGQPLVDNVGDFITATGEKAQQMFDKGRKTATEWVQKTAAEYVKRRDLTPEQQATVQKAMADPADPFVQSEMGKIAQGLANKERDFATLDGLERDFPEPKAAPGSKQSASTAGVESRIAQITEPFLKDKHPETVARANGVLRRVIAAAKEGDMNEPAARRLVQLLGAQGHEMVQRVYDAVAPKDAVADARMQRHINLMQKVGDRERGLGKVIDESLPDGHNINVTHLKEALTRWARGDDDIGVDARGQMTHDSMKAQIKSMFGPKADKVFDALEEYVKREDDKPGSTQNVKHDKDALDRGDQGSRRGDISKEVGADFGELDEGAMDPIYYGGGSNPLAMNELIEDPNVYRAKHEREGPAERLIKKLLGNDDLPEDLGGSGKRNVRFISEKDYNRRHGIRTPVLGEDGKPTGEMTKEVPGSTTHGYIVHEESNDPTKFNDNDFQATRLDAKKYGRSNSKIVVDSHVKDEKDSAGAVTKKGKKAYLIDAVRLTERFMRNQETGTGDPNVIRNGKAFMDGILALQEKLHGRGDKRTFVDDVGLEKLVADGEIPADANLEDYGIVHLPDSLVIDKFGNTYGDMKKAFAAIGSKDLKEERAGLRLTANEQAKLDEMRVKFKGATKEEQALLKLEAEGIYRDAKNRVRDKELAGDRENDLTRRKTSMGNKGSVAENASSFATGEGDVVKGKDKDGNPIYDLSARTQADAWFDEEGMAKAQKAINQLGDVHGGIDTGKVQERDRASYKQHVADRAGRAGTSTFGPPTAEKIAEDAKTTARDAGRVAAMNERSEQRSMPDARTGKAVEGYVKRKFDSSGSGRTEVSADENPHLVAAVEGENMGRGLNMDDSRQSIDFTKAFKNEEERRQLMNAVAKISEVGAPGAKIGRRLAMLIDAADSMRERDVAQLKRVGAQVLSGNLTPAEASTKINELSRKYAATIADRTETRQNPRGLVERVVRKSWGGEDSAGEPTKPVATRPVPPEPEMTKKGDKPYEGYNKGKPSATLKEALGTHSDELINPVERIQQALMNGDTPEVDMKTPRGRKVVKDFAKTSKEFDVTYGKDGQPVFTPKTEELSASLRKMRETEVDKSMPTPVNNAITEMKAMFDNGASAQEIATHAKTKMNEVVAAARKIGTRDAMDKAFATAHAIRGVAEQMGNHIDNTPLNQHIQGVLERGGTLREAMHGFAQHGTESERIIASAIAKVAGDVPLSLSDRSANGDMGAYHPGRNDIDIEQANKTRAAGTVLHEGVHAATVAGLANNPALMDAAHTLLKHVIEKDPSFAQRYAAGNSLEFIAESMSSPAHQEALRNIPASKEVKSMLGNVKNMWEAFTKLVSQALGIKPEHEHALSQLLEISGKAMKDTYKVDPTDAMLKLYTMQTPSITKEFNAGLESWRKGLNANGEKHLEYLKKNANPSYAHLLTMEKTTPTDVAGFQKYMNTTPFSEATGRVFTNMMDKAAANTRSVLKAGALPSELGGRTHYEQMMHDEGPHADGSAGAVNDEEHRYAARDRTAYDQMMDDEGPYQDGRAFSEEGTNRPKAVAAKEAALDKAVTSSNPALIRELRTTDDIHGLQRTYDHIADTAPDSKAMEAANARMREISMDDDAAYQMTLESKQSAAAAKGGPGGIPATTKQAIRDHITKVLGPQVLVAFRNILHEGDFSALAQTPRGIHDLIRISTHSLDPMSTAYHESLHGFVNNLRKAGLHDVVNVLQKAADSTYVRAQMEKIVGSDPAVMKQLRGADPEERIAYMYQLWASGALKLSDRPLTIVEKIKAVFNKVLGLWSNDERATHIMDYFNRGDYATDMHSRDLVMQKTMDVAHGDTMRKLQALTAPFTKVSDTIFAAGGQAVRDIGNPALDRMVDLIKRKAGDTKSSDPGYIAASRLAKTQFMNQIADTLGNLTDAQRKETLENLQTTVPAGSPESKAAARDIRKFLEGMHTYLTNAGVKIGDLGKSYFPRVWDANYISKNQHAFQGMLDKYVQRGDLTQREADDFLHKIIRTGGNEFDVNTLRPGMQSNKERVYSFIEHEDAARFQSKDIFRTMNDYVTQATRRAEWDRRFQGADSLNNIFDKARETGATDAHIKQAERYLQGITGVLGDSMNPTLRRLQGNMMVYQNIRLLPLAIFSSIIDPQGIVVRGGTVGEAWKAFTYGIKQIPNNLRDVPKADVRAELAETMGVIDNAMLSATLGEAYQQGMVGEVGRKINDKFFKYNLMEGWNRSMRIAATHAAVSFIAKHADGTYSKHSARFMDEMGLSPADIHYKANGELKLHEGDGLTMAQAHKMRVAVNNWVDGAILRPDAADKPTWGNDPRFALLFHLKQFTYSFQHTIIDRTMHEMKQGNWSPAMSLASYVPVMIAADMLKGFLTTGGVPSRKEDWGPVEYALDGIDRAGLRGVSQFKHDMFKDIRHGGTGLGAIEGPTLDQASEAIDVIRGQRAFKSFVWDSAPANKMFNSH